MADTKLKVWQKEISKEEWMKEMESGNPRLVGVNTKLGKYYKSDFVHPEYLKNRDAKLKKRAEKKAAMKKRALEIGLKKGTREGIKAFRQSPKMEKLLQTAFRKGMQAAKPKRTLEARIAKKEAKLAKEIATLEAMKAQKAVTKTPAEKKK